MRSSLSQNIEISSVDREAMGHIMRGTMTSAMREGNDPDGGYLVPEVISAQIEAMVLRQSPIRRVARIVDLSSPSTVLPINKRGTAAGWVGEGEDRSETAAPELAACRPPGGTLYALPKASEELVDDAIVNLEQFLEENVVDAFAETESQAFIRGNGIKKPAGFLDGVPTADPDSARALGTLQYIPSGDANILPGADLAAILVAIVFSMKAGYRQAPGVSWLAATDAIATLASVKDGEGRPLYVPSLREGVPGMLLGYPVIEAEHMDSVGAGAFPLAFGNWQRGYVIGDRTSLSILRDPYTIKGQILWYFRKRVHGCVLNSEAIKLLKIAEN